MKTQKSTQAKRGGFRTYLTTQFFPGCRDFFAAIQEKLSSRSRFKDDDLEVSSDSTHGNISYMWAELGCSACDNSYSANEIKAFDRCSK